MSGEHGDGLARSVWNAKLFGPEVYAAFEAVKHAFDPDDRMNPGKVVASPDPGDDLRLGPETITPRARGDRPRLLGAGRLRPRRRDVLGRRRLPQDRRRDDVPQLHGHPRRGAHDARAGPMPSAWSCPAPSPPTGSPTRRSSEALDLCLQCKACKTECPSNVDMAKLKAEFLHQYYKGRAVPLGSWLMGHIYRLNPIGSATAPLANWTMRQPAFRWLLEAVAGIDRQADPADVRPRPPPALVPPPRGRPARRDAGDGRPPGRLLHDLQQPRGRPGGGPGARGGRLPRRAGGPALLRPAGDLEGAAPARPRPGPRERPRSSSATRQAGTPILGCEPSCLLTLVDEYRDFRLGTDADLVAVGGPAGRRVRGRPGARPLAPPEAARKGVPCSTAIASRRRCWGRPGPSRPCGASPA